MHAEARQRGLGEAFFAVCAPRGNDALLAGGQTLKAFASLLTRPQTMLFIPLEDLLDAFEPALGPGSFYRDWLAYLRRRYIVE